MKCRSIVRPVLAVWLAVTFLPSARVEAQAATSQLELKDPTIARNNALYMPGGGYLYTGEYVKAGAALGITAIGLYEFVRQIGCTAASNSLGGADTGCSGAMKLVWLTASVAPYIYGIIDAPNSAERANEKMRQGKRTSALIEPGASGTVRVGLLYTFR